MWVVFFFYFFLLRAVQWSARWPFRRCGGGITMTVWQSGAQPSCNGWILSRWTPRLPVFFFSPLSLVSSFLLISSGCFCGSVSKWQLTGLLFVFECTLRTLSYSVTLSQLNQNKQNVNNRNLKCYYTSFWFISFVISYTELFILLSTIQLILSIKCWYFPSSLADTALFKEGVYDNDVEKIHSGASESEGGVESLRGCTSCSCYWSKMWGHAWQVTATY